MSEYIEAKDLEDFRNEIMSEFTALCHCDDYTEIALFRIEETIDRIYDKYYSKPLADVESKRGWIPVTERLPEKDGEYLALAKIGKLNLPIILCFAKDGRKIDEHDFEDMWENVWYEYDCEWGFVTKDFTTHWMPLPPPPETEKGGAE